MSALVTFLISPLGRYLVLGLVAAAGIGGEYAYMRVHYYNAGYSSALHAVAAKDKRAIDAANNAREAVKACRDSGGTWNIDGGVCDK